MLNRVREHHLNREIILLLAASPTGYLSTEDLIPLLLSRLNLSEGDLALTTRDQEVKIHQIIRNVISHRTSRSNLIGAGFAIYRDNGLEVTPKGRKFFT